MKSFDSTVWSSIRQAGQGRQTAINEFARRYWEPVVNFIQTRGYTPHDAEDLTQEVFIILFRDQLLAHAEKSRGRFRNFLLGVVKNILRNAARIQGAAKRGSGQPLKLLEDLDESIEALAQAAEDSDFDREWAQHLFDLAFGQLRIENPDHHEALRLLLDERLTYDEAAARLGLDRRGIENLVRQARSKVGKNVRSEIRAYCSSREEFEDEVARVKLNLKNPMEEKNKRT